MATAPAPPLPELDFEAMSAEELLRWAADEFAGRICLTCSWQRQSSVLVHMVSELGLDVPRRRARHAALLPRDVRDARPARRALRARADPAGDPHRRRAAPAGGPEPLGARPGPLLPHPQGRAARARARRLRRLDHRHPPRAVGDARRRAEGRVVGALRRLEDPAARRLGREARAGLHPRQRDPVQPAARPGVSRRSAAFLARGRSPRARTSAPAAGPARPSSSAASTATGGRAARSVAGGS